MVTGLSAFALFMLGVLNATQSTQQVVPSVQFTTTDRLEGCSISRYLGVVTTASPIVGDRASTQKGLPGAYQAAMQELRKQADSLGANWVLKLEFTVVYGYDRDGPATGHFPRYLAAVGTAVRAACP
jgi:uncharacterized protein YbjQ (UPF0145 family)